MEKRDRKSSFPLNLDEPPNSRLFIIGSKFLVEDDFRKSFEEFGQIEEIWAVKDKKSGENKGVTYIKYSRTSEAAKAMEAMNGKCIGNQKRSIRVMIASSRNEGSKREFNEEEKTLRLFVVVPKLMTDSELYDHFKHFGDIDYATIIRDKETHESKGFAYVKYFKFSHAAAAFENCDRRFRAVFAEPRKANKKTDEKFAGCSISTLLTNSFEVPDVTNSRCYTKLIAVVSPLVNQDQLWKLFDIVPGLDYCDLKLEGHPKPTKAVASVVYNNSQSAAYAKQKLHGFEYPPGHRIIVKPDFEGFQVGDSNQLLDKQKPTDISRIAEKIAQAGMNDGDVSSEIPRSSSGSISHLKHDEIPCSVKLPELQPLAAIDEPTVSRCFIVCTPNPLPNAILKNIFSRFGNLIDAYMLNNRNCGFAKYTNKESAENAIKVLHGAEICGIRIKVLKAEEKQDLNRKRQRLDDR